MTVAGFFASLAKILATAPKWLKAYFSDEKGQTMDASSENIQKYGNIRAKGDVNIKNINVNIMVDPTSPEYSSDQFRNFLGETSKEISSHSGLALGLDEGFAQGVESRSSLPLTEDQKTQIKKFTDAGWNLDKINSIILAYRIINAEDAGKISEAKQLMDSAFKGRKRALNRKMYNLARSGYLQDFVLDLFLSGKYKGDEAISKTLEYFPDAIFLDVLFMEDNLIGELQRREKEKVNKVSVYARSTRRIEIMDQGYKKYLKNKIDAATHSSDKTISIYKIKKKTSYKLGDNDGETLLLELDEVPNRPKALKPLMDSAEYVFLNDKK
jgi:hypothetical protein